MKLLFDQNISHRLVNQIIDIFPEAKQVRELGIESFVPVKFFKKLENTEGIYEVRVITYQKSIRILCFLDEGTLVVLTNAFIKKTQKTPKKEIKLAERLKNEYLNNKRK